MNNLNCSIKRWVSGLTVSVFVLLQGACTSSGDLNIHQSYLNKMPALEPVEEPYCVVSIHQIGHLDSAEKDLIKLNNHFGGTIELYRIPLLHASNISRIEKTVRPGEEGYFNLRLHLTPKGRKQWQALSEQFDGKNLAFVVDGVFYRLFKPRRFYSDTISNIMIDGPFDLVNAEKIQHYSTFNYQRLQQKN